VQFKVNGSVVGSPVTPNSSGQATYTTSTLATGASSITAVYSGDSNFNGSTSSTLSQTMNPSTTTALGLSANTVVYGQPVTFTATVTAGAPLTGTPTGSVQFNGVPGGSTVTLNSSGQATFTASALAVSGSPYSVSATYTPNSSTYVASTSSSSSLTVNKANTAAAVSSSSNPAIFGQPVTFTATISAVAPSTGTLTGTVQFSVNGSSVGSPVSLSSGQATYSSSLAVGSDAITAVYGGDSNFIGSTATALSQTVNKASQTITFTASTSPVTYGVSPITLVATGGASGNPVVFTLDASSTGTGTISGSTLTVTGVGTLVIDANQAGNANYSAATQVTQSIVVSQATPAITWTTPAAISYGTALGATQLDASSTVAGTFANSPAAGAVLGAGSQTLSVTFTPTNTTNYATATAHVTLAVNKASLLVTANSPAIAYGAAVPAYTAAITGFQGTDTAATAVTGSASLTTVPAAPSAVGDYTITTAQGTLAAANYTFSFANGSLTIAKATSSLTGPALSAQPVQVAFNQAGSVPVTVAGQYSGAGIATPTGTISYTIGTGNAQTAAISSGTATVSIPSTQASGLYTVAVTYAGDTDYSAATALSFQVQVGPQAQTIAFNSLAPVTYGAAPITLSASATTGLPVTFTVKSGPATLSGKVLTATGAGSVVIAADQAGNALWQAATEVTQALTVGKAAPAAIGLASSSNPVLVQNAVTLTATVSSAAGSPTGTVTFLDGSTPLGTGTLAGGVATLTTSGLAVGSHTITAVYGGDGNFVSATSSALTEVIDDFNLAISVTGGASTITSVTVLPGGTAVFTFVVSPINAATFPTAVTLSASGLPAGATATFSPATLAAGSGTTTVTLTIQIPQTAAALQPTHDLGRGLAPFALALLLLPFVGRLRHAGRRLSRAVSLLLLLSAGLAAAAGLSGCGSSSGFFGQQQTTYTVTVTGTSGALSHSTTVTLTVE
jgi:hypothetical protein